jgi:hypothetical protein
MNFYIKCSLIILLPLLLACDKRDASEKFNGDSNKFAAQIDAGLTTRVQEQTFIKEIAEDAYQFDRLERGTDHANATRAAAVASVK